MSSKLLQLYYYGKVEMGDFLSKHLIPTQLSSNNNINSIQQQIVIVYKSSSLV